MSSRHVLLVAMVSLAAALSSAAAQTSSSFKLQESVINAGGNPLQGSQLSSASYRIKLDSIGEAAVGVGASSASYRMDSAFLPAYRPPGEALGLRFSNKTTLVWNPEPSIGKYEVYRGLISSLPGTWGACFASSLASESAPDTQVPVKGTGYFYLVTARNRLGEEGTKGKRSNGSPRTNTNPCP
jgi:hypothetical protein